MAKSLADPRVCIFDVFGTVVDWRGSLIADLPGLGRNTGSKPMDQLRRRLARPLPAADAPRAKGELPWTNIDELHKGSLRDAALAKARPGSIPARRGRGVHPPVAQAPAVARFGRGIGM